MAGFTEPPKTTDPLEILRYFQEEAYKPKSEQTGIASKPKAEDSTSSVMKFFADWWTASEEKVNKAREELAPTMETLARESALLNAQQREAAGITQSLVEGGSEAYRKEPPEGTITRPVARPYELVTDTAKDVEESAPVTAETESTGLMSPVPPEKPLRPKARSWLTDDEMGLPDDDNYMGVLDDGPTQDLLDRIALGEGADPKKLKAQNKYGIGSTEYDMVYGYGSALAPDKPVTEMTMKELEAYQRKLIAATKGKVKGTTKGTSAVGKYQVIKTSLFGENGTAANPQKDSWADKLGLTEDTVYTPAIQEEIGFLALKEAGYNSYINGKRSQDSFQNKIANIWASVAKADGTDKYGQGIHTVKKDLEPMFKSLAPIKTEDTAVVTSLRPKARN